jgi:hypothetical protein
MADTDVRALAYTVVHKYTVALKRHTMVDAGVRRRRRQAAMALAETVDAAKMPIVHVVDVFDPHQYLYTLRLLRDSMTQSNQRLSCSELGCVYRTIPQQHFILLFQSLHTFSPDCVNCCCTPTILCMPR